MRPSGPLPEAARPRRSRSPAHRRRTPRSVAPPRSRSWRPSSAHARHDTGAGTRTVCRRERAECEERRMAHVFPGDDWLVEEPAQHDLDAALLDQAAAAVRKIDERWGFLVVKDGVIVHETYYSGDRETKHPVFSVTKGFGASLVGIAQKRGLLHVTDLISDWLPVHHPHIKEGATIEHILSMTAGGSPEANTYLYTSGPILNSLPNILWLATGKTPAQFFDEDLARPLGLTLDWPRNSRGWMQI